MMKQTDLCAPPPFSGMHIKVKAHCFVLVCVMPLRCQYQVGRELRIAPKRPDARDNVAKEGIVDMATKLDRVMKKRGAPGEIVVDDGVELFGCFERQSKTFSKLEENQY